MNSYHSPFTLSSSSPRRNENSHSWLALSLSLCSLSLSLCVLVVVVCFHFSPTKVGVRYKNKNSLPSSLSLVWTKVYAHHRLKCYNCVIKGLHEYFIRMVKGNFFVIIAARCLFFVHTREREREKERKRRARKNDGRKFCIYKIRETWKKNKSLLLLFCRDSRERERERLRNTLHNHAVFCQNFTLHFCWSSSPTKGRSILKRSERERRLRFIK